LHLADTKATTAWLGMRSKVGKRKNHLAWEFKPPIPDKYKSQYPFKDTGENTFCIFA